MPCASCNIERQLEVVIHVSARHLALVFTVRVPILKEDCDIKGFVLKVNQNRNDDGNRFYHTVQLKLCLTSYINLTYDFPIKLVEGSFSNKFILVVYSKNKFNFRQCLLYF